MKTVFVFFLSLFLSFSLFAQQKQGAWWFFGIKAGVNFNTNPPIPDLRGQSESNTASATISDVNGNLLFYTDGRNVYNRHHRVMLNGGNISFYSPKCLIVQKPGSQYIYYLFQANASSAGPEDFTYSEVDMLLDNGNGGLVPGKIGIPLLNNGINKITAAMHSNDRDVWVITHSHTGDTFYAFLVSPSGIAQPVTSNVGLFYNHLDDFSGNLKSSPNSELIAESQTWRYQVVMFDFNRATGILSNYRIFSTLMSSRPWGVAFSPDASKFYLNDTASIYQYDLNAGSHADVLSSKIKINNNSISYGLDMQLGLDGKIYALPNNTRPRPPQLGVNNPHLGVIHCPNEPGLACGFQDTAIYLGRPGGGMLPSLIQTYS